MAIPREQLQAVVDAGYPDKALIGMPVSLLREILSVLPVTTVPASQPVWCVLDLARAEEAR